MTGSHLEAALRLQLRAYEFPTWVEEYQFHPKRRWRFDFAWPDERVAVEVEGGIYSGGRHTRGTGFTGDCDKYNAAALDKWTVLRFTAGHIDNGKAVLVIGEALNHEVHRC